MVNIHGRYGTNHPKDVAARRLQQTARIISEQGCTRRELDNPTESNVQKCMHEMKATTRAGEQFKSDAHLLGEDSNLNKYRRR